MAETASSSVEDYIMAPVPRKMVIAYLLTGLVPRAGHEYGRRCVIDSDVIRQPINPRGPTHPETGTNRID